MKEKRFNLPDEAALLRVLKRNEKFAAELIIRLAWQAGLTRRQIHDLTWDQISFDSAEIRLPTHTAPIHPDLLKCLQLRRQRPTAQKTEYVVLTDARHTHPHEVMISRIIGEVLDEEESLKDISIKDLRDDFIIRALEQHGKAYALRVSGIAMGTLYMTYGQYLSHSRGNVTEGSPSAPAEIDEARLMEFLAGEGTSAAAMTLWLSWKQGMELEEIVSCTWNQIDFEKNVIRLADRESEMHPVVAQLLKEIHDSREEGVDPHVILTPKAKTPFRPERLTVVTRTALYQNGLESLYLSDLSFLEDKKEREEKILSYVRENRFITNQGVMSLLRKSYAASYAELSRLVKRGELVRVGLRYYISGTVVPPEKHYEVICKYLRENGPAYSGDIAKILGVERRACSWILHKMVEEETIIQRGQTYHLTENE